MGSINKSIKALLLLLAILLIAIALLLVSSCSPKVLPPAQRDTTTIVKTEYKEILRDTTIYITLPRDSTSIVTEDTTSTLTIRSAISTALIAQGRFYHSLYANPNYKPEVVIQYKDKESIKDSIVYATNTEYVEVNRLTQMQSFWVVGGKIFAGLVAFLLLWFVIKKFVLKI
jgi:hypothetical protein